jgi:ABC-2 type transport system permease protein
VRLAWEFFKRDALIAMSYRTAFAVQLVGNLVLLGIFYFIGQLVGAAEIPALERYGGNYMAFMLIGIALTDCVGVSLSTFANNIREGQLTGTLEATLMSAVPLPVILIYSSLWSYFFSAVRFVFYLALGTVMYGVQMQADLLAGLIIFVLTVLCFAGVGIFWASIVMLLKRGQAILNTFGIVAILVSGVLFPTSMLPEWLGSMAQLIPLTHALDGMRLALLHGQGVVEQAGTIFVLLAFAASLLAVGISTFEWTVGIAKRTGSLVEY